MKVNKAFTNFIPYLVLILAIVGIFAIGGNTEPKKLGYVEIYEVIRDKDVQYVEVIADGQITKIKGKYVENGTTYVFSGGFLATEKNINDIYTLIDEKKIPNVPAVDANETNFFLDTLMTIIPFILLGVVAFVMIGKMNNQNNGKAFEFGRSRARLEGNVKIKFNDVASYEEEKEEMEELIDYLRNPKKFSKLGARIPKGILLVGSPGTGKTLLAKAVAGEAEVPFYSISGSDFVEMFVGVGASRVRDMFKKAKQTAPSIIFIDEIDAVGRQRGTGLGGGHDEREQTLNQLLVEMDGISDNAGIVIIAATNRPDVLDPALLRPGRFDRQITVNLPDKKGREEILKVHARNKKMAPEVNLGNIAQRTPGFSGADLENVLNESALLAVRHNKESIDMLDIDEAIDRVMGGPAKKSRVYSPEEKRLVSFHESGHALIGLKLDHAKTVQKVTIIPRGMAGGYTLMTPKEERFLHTRSDLQAMITGYLGGRVAEEIIFGEISTGAHKDIEEATKIARSMVMEYGMSKLGPIQYEHGGGNVFLGRDYSSQQRNYSSQIAFEIDQEVRNIVEESYEQAKTILTENRKELDLIAETLLQVETLTNEQIVYLLEHGQLPVNEA